MKNFAKAFIIALVLTLMLGVGSAALADTALLDDYASATVNVLTAGGGEIAGGWQNHTFENGEGVRFELSLNLQPSDFYIGGQVDTESEIYKEKYESFYNEKYQSVYDEVYQDAYDEAYASVYDIAYQEEKTKMYDWWYAYLLPYWGEEAARWAHNYVNYDQYTLGIIQNNAAANAAGKAKTSAEDEVHKLVDAYASEQAAKYALEGETDLHHVIREAYYESKNYVTEENGEKVTGTVENPRFPKLIPADPEDTSVGTVFMVPFEGIEYLDLKADVVPMSQEDRQGPIKDSKSGLEVFYWWVDKETGKVCIQFTEEALTTTDQTIGTMKIGVTGNLNLSDTGTENKITFGVANQTQTLNIANEFNIAKQANSLTYDGKDYTASYTVTLNLKRDQDLEKLPLTITDTWGEYLTEPEAASVSATPAVEGGDDIAVTFDAQKGLFSISSSENTLKAGKYTITYKAKVKKEIGDQLNKNDGKLNDGTEFNYSDNRKNTVVLNEKNVPVTDEASAWVNYTKLSDQVRLAKRVDTSDTSKTYIQGVYTETDEAGNTSYYIDYYLDVGLQNPAHEFKVTDTGNEWLTHVAGDVEVTYSAAWNYDDNYFSAVSSSSVKVESTINPEGKREFKVKAEGAEAQLPTGTYRLKYRMKLSDAVIEKALGTGNTSGEAVTAANTAGSVTVDGRTATKDATSTVYIPSASQSTSKSGKIIEVDENTHLIKWEARFQWDFHQDGTGSVTDTLKSGAYHINESYPFTIINGGNKIVELTSNESANGVTFNDSGFTYELGDSGDTDEKLNQQYIITYYTTFEGDVSAAANGFSTDFDGDGNTDGPGVETTPEEEEEPDDPVIPETPEYPDVTKTPGVVKSNGDKKILDWTVTIDLKNVPFEQLSKWEIVDTIPYNQQWCMKLTDDLKPAVTLDDSTVALAESCYTVTTAANGYTQTVTLNLEEIRKSYTDVRKATVVFTTEVTEQNGNNYFVNSAKMNYAYGSFDLSTNDEWSDLSYQTSSKSNWLNQMDVYDETEGSFGWGSSTGVKDYVYQITLRDPIFKQRGQDTTITIRDELPTATINGQEVRVFEVLPDTVQAADYDLIQSENQPGGRKIPQTSVSVIKKDYGFDAKIVVPGDWAYDYVYVFYNCELSNEFRTAQKGDTYLNNLENKATVSWEGEKSELKDIGAGGTYDDRLAKKAAKISTGSDGYKYAHKIDYTITINPGAADLDPQSDVLTLTDAFTEGKDKIHYDKSTFVLKSGSTILQWGDAVSKTTYTLEFAEDLDSFVLSVPDSTEITLSYSANLDAVPDEKIEAIANKATLQGVTKENKQDKIQYSKPSASVEVEVNKTDRYIDVYKVGESDRDILEGAVFEVYIVTGVENGQPVLSDEPFKTSAATAGKEGTTCIVFANDEKKNEIDHVFALKEKTAPKGYKTTDEVWYFYFSQIDSEGNAMVSAGVQAVAAALQAQNITVKYVEKQQSYPFTAHNEWVGYSFCFKKVNGDGEALSGVSFKLTDTNGVELTATSGDDGVVTFEALNPNTTYVLTEMTVPTGYVTPVDGWQVEVADDGTVTVTGEGYNLTEDGAHTIVNVKETPKEVSVTVQAAKTLQNAEKLGENQSFTFDMKLEPTEAYAADATTAKTTGYLLANDAADGTEDGAVTVQITCGAADTAAKTSSFGTITFTEPGVYVFKVSEPAEAMDKSYIVYSNAVYYLEYTVSAEMQVTLNVYNKEERVEANRVSTHTGEAAATFTASFTNTYESIDLSGTKVWDDEGNDYGLRPDSVTIWLYKTVGDANPTKEGQYVTLTATGEGDSKTWPTEWSFTNLPVRTAAGETITYSVQEEFDSPYYTSEIDGNTVKNTLSKAETEFSISKTVETDATSIAEKTFTFVITPQGNYTGKLAFVDG